MGINIKKLSLIVIATFSITGCNIYRQMVLPTPYYPGVESTVTEEPAPVTQSEASQTIEARTEVNQYTPIKESKIQVTNKTVVQRIPFPEQEYNSLPKTGSATVEGSIFITAPNGKRIYGKHTRLYLNPVTSYSTQWYKESYLGGAKMSQVDPRLYNYLKFTTSDEKGHFEFLNVPNGSYYLIGVVKCGQECGYSQLKSIRVAKKINVFGSGLSGIELTK